MDGRERRGVGQGEGEVGVPSMRALLAGRRGDQGAWEGGGEERKKAGRREAEGRVRHTHPGLVYVFKPTTLLQPD